MEKNMIQQLMEDIEIYEQTLQNLQDLLETAEKELDEILASKYEQENRPKLTIVK